MIRRLSLLALWTTFLLLAGCSTTLPSGENVFENQDEEESVLTKTPSLSLEEAIENTESDLLERFWFRAHIANNIEKRRITHMTLNGIVIRPHGYYMNNSLITKPYEYYRRDDETYIRQGQNWFRGREPHLPFDPFYGFSEWKQYLERAKFVREDAVLSVPTDVYEIELSGTELLEMETPFIEQLALEELSHLENMLHETKLRVLFYVGDIDKGNDDKKVLPVIYKYQTWIQMPIPGAGYMEQEVQYFIFRVNDENVEMTSVEEIEKYLIEIEDYHYQMLELFNEEMKKLAK